MRDALRDVTSGHGVGNNADLVGTGESEGDFG